MTGSLASCGSKVVPRYVSQLAGGIVRYGENQMQLRRMVWIPSLRKSGEGWGNAIVGKKAGGTGCASGQTKILANVPFVPDFQKIQTVASISILALCPIIARNSFLTLESGSICPPVGSIESHQISEWE